MRRFRSVLNSDNLLFILFSVIILSLSFYYLFYHINQAAKVNSYFPQIHNYNTDFNFYLHLIRQSSEGNWAFITRYTPEFYPPRLTYLPYLLIGKFALLTNMEINLSYTLSRLFLGITFLILIFILIKICYPKNNLQRKLALFLTIFGTSFWQFTYSKGIFQSGRFLDFWTELNPLEKFVYLPHHLMGKVFLLLSIILIFKSISRHKLRYLLLACLSGLISGFSSPYPLFNLEIILAVFMIISVFFYRDNFKILYSIFFHVLIFVPVSSFSLLYYYFLQHSTFPWNSYLSWEQTAYTILSSHFLLSLGPNFILAILALPSLFKRKRLIDILLLSWILGPFLGVIFLSRLNFLADVRFLASAHFIPVGILAAMGLNQLTGKISTLLKLNKYLILSVFILLLSSIYTVDLYENLDSQIKAFSPYYYNQFLSKDLLSSFAFLNKNTPSNSVVLSGGFMANLIPAYSHNKTVTGHPNFTYEFAQKNGDIVKFFQQNDPDFGRLFLYKYNISYVFFGSDTPAVNWDFMDKLYLKKFFSNPAVTILSVR